MIRSLFLALALAASAFAQLPTDPIPNSDGATFRGRVNANFEYLDAAKAPKASPTFTGTVTIGSTTLDATNGVSTPKVSAPATTPAELGGACETAAAVTLPATGEYTLFFDSANSCRLSMLDHSRAVTVIGSPMVYPGTGIPSSTGSAWDTSYTTSTAIATPGVDTKLPTEKAVRDLFSTLPTSGYVAVPASASATGTAGQYSGDSSYFYLAIASNSWKRVAWDGSWLPDAVAPTFSPTAGTYTGDQGVTISSTTPSATLCYTTDGSTPTASAGTCSTGSTYSGPVTVAQSSTLKALASKTGYNNSSVGSAAYTITASTPMFSPAAGSVASGTAVTISTASSGCGSAIYWNTTGSPTGGDNHGTSVTVNSTETVYAKVIGCANHSDSAVGSAAYTVSVAASDSFTGAAGALSGSWTQLLAHNVTLDGSGNAHGNTAFWDAIAEWTGTAFAANQYSEIVIGALAGTDFMGVAVHLGAGGNGYMARVNGSTGLIDLVRLTTGSYTSLRSQSACSNTTTTAGDTVRLSVSGTILTVTKNGSPVTGCSYDYNADGTKYTTGGPGIGVNRGNGGADPKVASWAAAEI